MTKKALAFSAIIFFLFSSCRKTELAQQESIIDLTSADKTAGIAALSKGVVSDAHWYGNYYSVVFPDPGGDPDVADVSDAHIINGGVATVPVLAGALSYLSYIYFYIPEQYNISGDSIIYEVVVKN